MYPIKFRTRVVYASMFVGDSYNEDYKDFDVFASNQTEAKQITKELFSVLDGSSIVKIGCKAVTPPEDIGIKILREWRLAVHKLNDDLFGKTYPDMLDLFLKYEGFDAEMSNCRLVGFKFKLLNFTMRIVLKGGRLEADQSWGYYYGLHSDAYVILDNIVYESK